MHSRSKKFWQRKIAKEKSGSPWNGSRRMRHGSSGVVRVSSLPSYGHGKSAEKAVWRCGKGSTATPKCPSRDAKEAFLRCGRGSFASRRYVFRLTKSASGWLTRCCANRSKRAYLQPDAFSCAKTGVFWSYGEYLFIQRYVITHIYTIIPWQNNRHNVIPRKRHGTQSLWREK